MRQRTVCVVEDDEAVRGSLRLLLEAVGMEVRTHRSAEALLAETTGDRPSCLVLDMHLPGMNGLELLEHLVARQIHLPTILISARAIAVSRDQASRLGVRAFFQKPFGDDAFIARVHCLVGTEAAASTRRP